MCLSHLVQQGAHTCKHLRSSQGLAFLQAALSLWRRGNLAQTIPYKLQTCTLLLLRKDSFLFSFVCPMLDEALRRIEDFKQADSTLHHAPHRHQQTIEVITKQTNKPNKPSEQKKPTQTNKKTNPDLRLAIHHVCILHAPPPPVLKGGHFSVLQICVG